MGGISKEMGKIEVEFEKSEWVPIKVIVIKEDNGFEKRREELYRFWVDFWLGDSLERRLWSEEIRKRHKKEEKVIKKFEGYVPKLENIVTTFEEGLIFWGTKTFGMFNLKGMKEERVFYPEGMVKRTITIEVKDEEV